MHLVVNNICLSPPPPFPPPLPPSHPITCRVSTVSTLMEKSDFCSLFLLWFVASGGSLAKVAYMSEVRTIRKRHYSFSSLTSLAKSEDEEQEKGV